MIGTIIGVMPSGRSKFQRPLVDKLLSDMRRQDVGSVREVNWTNSQNMLFEAKCDVAVILNCCHAATASLKQILKGRNEILAAANRESVAYTGPHSYLKRLKRLLEDYAKKGEPFSLAKLHNDLDSQIKAIVKSRGNASSPYHAVYPDWNQSITLRPLQNPVPAPVPVPVPTPGPASTPRYLYAKFEIRQPTSDEQTVSAWQRWFTSGVMPRQVHGVKFLTEADLFDSE
jgi:hypothetical protein